MGKAKRNKQAHGKAKPYAKPGAGKSTNKSPRGKDNAPPSQNKSLTVKVKGPAQQTKPVVPFEPGNNILLIGEGDFSFSKALLRAHRCSHLTCTTFESRESLLEKYPQSEEIVGDLEDPSDDEDGLSGDGENDDDTESEVEDRERSSNRQSKNVKVLYSIDATKLGKPHSASAPEIRKRGPYDRIVFNFPHVGGLSKDVNRQVRANQQLLVGFFNAAKPLLMKAGVIVVTIFEGEPYELWGIRNLARHRGLRVGRSFSFDASLYPGYHHARTLGNLRGETGWRGEDRPARMYLLLGQDDELHEETMSKKRKLEKEAESDDESFDGLD